MLKKPLFRYTKNAERVASMIAKKPFKPAEMIIKWTEFAAEFQDLSNLDIAGRDYSFIKYYCLDIWAPLLLIILTVSLVMLKIGKMIIEKLLKATMPQKQKTS